MGTAVDAGAHERPRPGRVGLLILALLAMATGIAGGLQRAGVPWELPSAAALHGALMINGFLGTVISLERAIAYGHPLGYAAPISAGLGAVAMLAGLHEEGRVLWIMAPLALLAVSLAIVKRQPAAHTVLLAVAAAAWLAGQGLAFLVLTIAAERLEMTRLARRPKLAQPLFFACIALLPFAFGPALIAIALWLAVFDIARHTVRRPGLPRFAALALMAGYAWLFVGGLAWSLGWPRDIAIHAVTIGFVFSMIMAHAPIIVPVVARVPVRFTPRFYAPLGLLHLSLLIRMHERLWGAMLGAAAIAIFIFVLISALQKE